MLLQVFGGPLKKKTMQYVLFLNIELNMENTQTLKQNGAHFLAYFTLIAQLGPLVSGFPSIYQLLQGSITELKVGTL